MKKIIIILMGIFLIVGEYTVINTILELLNLEANLYIVYIVYIAMILFNVYMIGIYDEEVIKQHEQGK